MFEHFEKKRQRDGTAARREEQTALQALRRIRAPRQGRHDNFDLLPWSDAGWRRDAEDHAQQGRRRIHAATVRHIRCEYSNMVCSIKDNFTRTHRGNPARD